ncbi:MAG: prepilin peptidase [Candidatus Omnitrophota bacterium]|nr:prepilin peptidase [Candidatus Omnitrophota bacterium]
MDKAIVFVLGSIIGSFLNVCIYRLPKGKSVIFQPSSCPGCGKHILWHDNIPVLSYCALRGRCRFCKARISPRYIIVEILTAGVLALIFAAFGMTPKFFAYSLMACGLIVATFVDFEIHEIPDQVSIGGLIAGISLSAAFPSIFDVTLRSHGILNSFAGIFAGGGSIYIMGFFGELVFGREAMGGGDVKLMAMIGSFLGWKLVILTFFIAPIFGAVIGIILRIKDGREIIPYGPYLSLAALLTVFFGERILRVFLRGMY